MRSFLSVMGLVLVVFVSDVEADEDAVVPGVNRIEVYRARWWGTEGSARSRPIYRIIHIDNDRLEIRHAIVSGRELGHYTLPYWRVKSFLSILNRPAELASTCRVTFSMGGELQRAELVVRRGFALARHGDADVLKITNEGGDASVLIDYFVVVPQANSTLQVYVRVTNTGKRTLSDVVLTSDYRESFNWSRFGISADRRYQPVIAPDTDSARSFFAFSSGMQRGYEFVAGEDSVLRYALSPSMNGWRVTMSSEATALAPGASAGFRFAVRVLDDVPDQRVVPEIVPTAALLDLPFRDVQPTVYKTAPVQDDGRVRLGQVIDNLRRPKVRGLNLRAGFPQAMKDLDTLKDWGCNLVITGIGRPEKTRRFIARGHALGMEMLLHGVGGFHDGPPRFDRYYQREVPPSQRADGHGQDEDHYYWYGLRPTRDFPNDFGKPMALATQEEKVLYWSQCMADKWRGILTTVRKHAPEGNVWFYIPSPTVAHVNPLDYHDIFFREVVKLGDALTVFPFYYGVEYRQAEYMVRRWKDAGASRVVFLPMCGFMARPSQFIRAITAARRGQADGACGFFFPVGEEKPGQDWQWKSVMLAAQANFPTPELDAFCFMEEPAELLETLAKSDVTIVPADLGARGFAQQLSALLPGRVTVAERAPKQRSNNQLLILVGEADMPNPPKWPYDLHWENLGPGKGVLQMRDGIISLRGTDPAGVANAKKLFLRFASLTRTERVERKRG